VRVSAVTKTLPLVTIQPASQPASPPPPSPPPDASHIQPPARCHPPRPQVSTTATFYASAAAGIVGALLTWVFLPDTTGLDLGEIDRMHRYMLAGQVGWAAALAAALGGVPCLSTELANAGMSRAV
jgi:hypothetical protein